MFEKGIGRLKSEMDSIRDNVSEYEKIKKMVFEINELSEEIDSVKSARMALNEGNTKEEKWDASGEIAEKGLLIEKIDGELSKLSKTIRSPLMQLERTAKKYDHIMGSKDRLVDIILNPESLIRSREDYDVLVDKLNDMKDRVNRGEIEVKKNGHVVNTIMDVMASELYQNLESYKKILYDRSIVADELRVLKAVDESAKARRGEIEMGVRSADELKGRLESLEKRYNEVIKF
ncbi:hypothetical protein B1B_00031, partial [mine drainage metagenome]